MTQLSRDDMQRLAELSGLHLTETEMTEIGNDITSILTYVKQLDELDTESVLPTYQVTGLQNVWRDDEVVESDVSRAELLALAPDTAEYQVKVPKVL